MKPIETKAFDKRKNCQLQSTLKQDQLFLKLRVCDYEKATINIYESILTDDSLTPQIKIAFGNVNDLFKKCFSKNQNYIIEPNGRINLKYKIVLENEEVVKVQSIHLIGVITSEKQMMKEMIEGMKNQLKKYQGKCEFDLNSFSLQGRTIKKTDKDRVWEQLLLSEVIPHTQLTSFSFKIIKTKSSNIMIGVVDRNRRGQNSSYQSEGNAISYYGRGGYIYPDGLRQGAGFTNGDIVECLVNLKEGIVTWFVNKLEQTCIQKPFLQQNGRNFVPFIELSNENDTVQWIGMKSQ